ncbi:DUF3280 domain-containing protein [Steroidobacter sp. S1-65]|uniref:DUF3280 domain-containing protein n=1 Tax=Steroidobacter gossypii TaxID=2805490 RepID=A0ABS1WYH7_9GAMM|nr:DUF3280 domain-containing protein [Steroidobacter gossypii]MBM0106025.1 DUF3280 domain-containing protein [Steroidobacter gossypii]
MALCTAYDRHMKTQMRKTGSNNRAAWVLSLGLSACAPAAIAADPGTRPELLVLDIELTGDLGGTEPSAEQTERLQLTSARLREYLSRSGLYEVVDPAPVQDHIDQLRSQHRYLHDCNGCDLEVGRELGADQVMVAWVHRISALILDLTYEIHDVASGQIAARKSFSFRGDNDASWTRAVDYMVRDLKESSERHAGEPR